MTNGLASSPISPAAKTPTSLCSLSPAVRAGQNAIGPEQDGELGVIRTEELLAAGQHYGVRQYFTRAMDFGFSKSPDQTMKIWGDLVLEDMVRVIRTYRPDVVINGWGGVHSGHGHHQASGILTPEAVQLAAIPQKYPDQIKEGLPPGRPRSSSASSATAPAKALCCRSSKFLRSGARATRKWVRKVTSCTAPRARPPSPATHFSAAR